MECKGTGILMVTVKRRSEFMRLWIRLTPFYLNVKVHCHKWQEFIFGLWMNKNFSI
jgi:hypothetical protein